jgi:hypothetical protein|tara:strand:+ start:76 stop:285 length:210 start_codon:yes stop_codon:yes gene_type:complete
MAYGHGKNVRTNSKDLAINGGYIKGNKATWRDDYSSDRLRTCKICNLAIDVPKGGHPSDNKTGICTLCE